MDDLQAERWREGLQTELDRESCYSNEDAWTPERIYVAFRAAATGGSFA